MYFNLINGLVLSIVFLSCVSLKNHSQNEQANQQRQISSDVQAGVGMTCDLQKDKESLKELTEAQKYKSYYLGDKINNTLESLYEKHRANGKDLKVVIVGRMGSGLTKFKILKDNEGKESINSIIQRLLQDSRNSIENRYEGSAVENKIDYRLLQKQIDTSQTLKYSHIGIAFRNMRLTERTTNKVVTGPGTRKWSFYHLLYSAGNPDESKQEAVPLQAEHIKRSHIFKGTVHAFFMDHLSGYEAQVIVPTQSVQDNIEQMLLKDHSLLTPKEGTRGVYDFQTDQYNAAAKFTDLTQQNSNQFVLEALAAALRPVGTIQSRESAIQVLKQTGFSASKLLPTGLYSVMSIPVVQNLVSSLMPTVCLRAQPELKEYGVGEIVTANSILNWMERNKIVDQKFEIKLSQKEMDDIDPESETRPEVRGPNY